MLPRAWRCEGGRGFRDGFPRAAIVSPYLPWPQAHGGAVRIANLLKKCSEHFDIVLFGFEDAQRPEDYECMRRVCALVYAADKPRWREPRWSTLLPPEACEFYTPELDRELRRTMEEHGVRLLQAEYTPMARYRPDVLVEHDITWDLFEQVHRRRRSLASWWDLWRWRRFERKALRAARRVVVMSDKDAALAGVPDKTVVIPNGVDLNRFRPGPSPQRGRRSCSSSVRSVISRTCARSCSCSRRCGRGWRAGTCG